MIIVLIESKTTVPNKMMTTAVETATRTQEQMMTMTITHMKTLILEILIQKTLIQETLIQKTLILSLQIREGEILEPDTRTLMEEMMDMEGTKIPMQELETLMDEEEILMEEEVILIRKLRIRMEEGGIVIPRREILLQGEGIVMLGEEIVMEGEERLMDGNLLMIGLGGIMMLGMIEVTQPKIHTTIVTTPTRTTQQGTTSPPTTTGTHTTRAPVEQTQDTTTTKLGPTNKTTVATTTTRSKDLKAKPRRQSKSRTLQAGRVLSYLAKLINMYKDMKLVVTKKNASKLFPLLPEKFDLTVSEAEKTLIVGHALTFETDLQVVKKFLNFLPKIQQISIIGVNQQISGKILNQFIVEYYRILDKLQSKLDISTKYIENSISSHIYKFRDDVIGKFIMNPTKHSMMGVEIEAWSQNTHLSAELGRSLLETIYYRYLRGLKVDIKFTEVHTKLIALILAIIKSQPSIIQENNSVVIDVFKITFKLANKFVNKKTGSKKLFSVCIDFQFYSLTFHKFLEENLKDFNLKSVYGKYPSINCWAYYSLQLLQLLNVNILIEILEMLNSYLPELDENYAYHLTMSYLDLIKSCQIYLKEFSDKLLMLSIEYARTYPKCLELFKMKINSLPNYIKDDAKWAYVYLKLSDEEVPKVIIDSFKNLQSREEALHVFRVLSNVIPTCDYNELELILNELSKITLNYEIIEFVAECVKILMKKHQKIDLFNTLDDVYEKIVLMVKVLANKAKEIRPNKLLNKFWMFLTHFLIQTGRSFECLASEMKTIARVTVWEYTKVSISSNQSNLHKVKQKLSQGFGFSAKDGYIELLNVLVNCVILGFQYDCDGFLEDCLNSSLPTAIQDIILSSYFEHLKQQVYDQDRISNDIKFLIFYLALNEKRDFIEALLNSDTISRLHSCYSYQFIHCLSSSPLLIFSLNILGVSSLNHQGENQLHHTSQTISISNPTKFFKFFLKFMQKALSHSLIVSRNETLLSFSKFLESSNNSPEDKFSVNFFYKTCEIYQRKKVNAKIFYDLLGFHKWFNKIQNRLLAENKKKSKGGSIGKKVGKEGARKERKSNLANGMKEVQRVTGFYLEYSGSGKKFKDLIDGNLKGFEFAFELSLFIESVFESKEKRSLGFDEKLMILSGIIANNPKETGNIYSVFHILLVKYLQIVYDPVFEEPQNLDYQYEINLEARKKPILSDEFIESLIKFMENQLNLCVLQKKPEICLLSKTFESLLNNTHLRRPLTILNLSELTLKISHPIHNLPNSHLLYSKTVSALFRINKPSYCPNSDLLKKYLKLMKVNFK